MRRKSGSAPTQLKASTRSDIAWIAGGKHAFIRKQEKNYDLQGSSVRFGLLLSSLTAFATIFGTVSGLIHDPQHRPVQGAQVTLHAANSAWTKSVTSNDSGEFRFDSVPLGEYTVTVELAGFAVGGAETRPQLRPRYPHSTFR